MSAIPPADNAFPRSWLLDRLPGQSTAAGQVYTFDIGPLEYAGDRGGIYLHIPEIGCRDAEGRPLYPEQDAWVAKVLTERGISTKAIWYSTWQFTSPQAVDTFEAYLWSCGAFRLWTLTEISTEPGVLLERVFFEIIPACDMTFRLSIRTEPGELRFEQKQADRVRRLLLDCNLPSTEELEPARWIFADVAAITCFEQVIKQRGARYAGESYYL